MMSRDMPAWYMYICIVTQNVGVFPISWNVQNLCNRYDCDVPSLCTLLTIIHAYGIVRKLNLV